MELYMPVYMIYYYILVLAADSLGMYLCSFPVLFWSLVSSGLVLGFY